MFFRVLLDPLESCVLTCPSKYDDTTTVQDLEKVEELLNSLVFPRSSNNEEIEELLYSFVLPEHYSNDNFRSGKIG